MFNSSSKESEGVDPSESGSEKLKGYQLRYLRALAHSLKPVILIGQKRITDSVILSLEEALAHHELIKVKFVDHKANADKQMMVADMQRQTRAYFIGMVGHVATFYRPNMVLEKRKIKLPQRETSRTVGSH